MDERRDKEDGENLEIKYLCIDNNDSCIQHFLRYMGWGKCPNIIAFISYGWYLYFGTKLMWNIYIYMVNGTSKIRLQLVVYLISAFISAPTMYFLCSKFGIAMMLLVPISICLIQALVAKKQLAKIIRGTASGIWIK